MYKNYLFDLDGTLLPMDMKYFVELFLAAYCKKMVPITKIHADTLTDAIWTGVGNTARSDGNCLNSDIFWRSMNRVCHRDMRPFSDVIDNFYRTEFDAARAATKLQPLSRTCVEYIKAHGGKLIVATNPIFRNPPPTAVSNGQGLMSTLLTISPPTTTRPPASRI